MAIAQSKRWCFTFNNAPAGWTPPTGSEIEYMVWQREKGKESGLEHVQGYVRFQGRKRLRSAKAWFSVEEIHMEVARGSEKQNKAYCTKEDTRIEGPFEYGEFDEGAGQQGKRSDLEDIADKLKQGATIKQIVEDHAQSYIRYHQGIEKLRDVVQPLPPLQRTVKCTVLWGETGTGKTHRARTQYPDIYEVIAGRDPWGTYSGQEAILFDEFNWERWTIQDMNRFCDKWRCQLDCRYKDKYAAWTRVVICANSEPYMWWPNQDQPLRQAFWRRIEQVQVVSREQEINLVVVDQQT